MLLEIVLDTEGIIFLSPQSCIIPTVLKKPRQECVSTMNSTDDKKSVEENGKKEESKAKIESEKADGDWDTLYNDSGECLVQDLEKVF